MKIYDISQEVFGCEVYPGDPAPEWIEEQRMARGDLYNLTSFSMCAHNGTHLDAPFHFCPDGRTVEQIPLEKTVGLCYVAGHGGDMRAEGADAILKLAQQANPEAARRILIRGESVVSEEAAAVFASAGIDLLGVESVSVGPVDAPMAVHKILLGAEVVLLEGLRLHAVPEGIYLLSAAPLALAGSDGAPCRAVLMQQEEVQMLYQLIITDTELSYTGHSEDFNIGIFESVQQAEAVAQRYLRSVPGFCEYPCTYQILPKEVIGSAHAPDTVWTVQGWNTDEKLGEVDILESDCLCTRELAEAECAALQKTHSRSEWAINKWALNCPEWAEGFRREANR